MRDFVHVDDVAAANVAAVNANRDGFSAFNVCSGRPISILEVATELCETRGDVLPLVTGQYPHVNGMTGLAHRGWELDDNRQHLVHTLRRAGYFSELIGEQHVSATPDALGYDRFHEIDSNHVATVAPLAVGALEGGLPEPFFLSVGFFETHRRFFEPTSTHDELYALPPEHLPDLPEVRRDMAHFLASARSLRSSAPVSTSARS